MMKRNVIKRILVCCLVVLILGLVGCNSHVALDSSYSDNAVPTQTITCATTDSADSGTSTVYTPSTGANTTKINTELSVTTVPKCSLLKITVAQNKQNNPKRVSTWRTAAETDYIIYFDNVDSVKVKTADGYQDLLTAVHNGAVDMDELRSDLMIFAQENDVPILCMDGRLDDAPYARTIMRFTDFTVTFTGHFTEHQTRREVFFSPPNNSGLTKNIQQRIAEETAKFPLTVQKSAADTLTKVTRPEWDLPYDVYYYNIDSASVMLDGKAVDLLDAVSQGDLTFEQLVADADALDDCIYNTMYKDGGSMLYRFDDYAILKRNTLNGNKTLYIGTRDLTPNSPSVAEYDTQEFGY